MAPVPDLYRVMDEREATREQRFTELFTDCYGPVLAFARRRLNADLAQDVVAETFLTAWRHLDDLSGESLPWLYGVASNAIANQRRSASRRRRLDDRARLMVADVQASDPVEDIMLRSALSVAFGSLSERDREILRLATWERLDAAAAASVFGCSPATFRVQLHRARRRLSSLLERENRTDADPTTLPLETEETL